MAHKKKIILKRFLLKNTSLIRTELVNEKRFGGGWHVHTEYEFVYILKSSGTIFAGDNVSPYSEGDLFLFGSNLPHSMVCDEGGTPSAVVVHFKPKLFSEAILTDPEYNLLQILLKRASSGLRFTQKDVALISALITEVVTLEGFDLVLTILKLLNECSKIPNSTQLASEGYMERTSMNGDEKLYRILSFIELNHAKSLKLEEVAKMANMQTNAFCRYFKSRTNETVFAYINKVRIATACKLLLREDLSIQEICYKSGYGSSSHFITQFRKQTSKTPREYREYHTKQLHGKECILESERYK